MKSQATPMSVIRRRELYRAMADMVCIISICVFAGYAFSELAVYLDSLIGH